MFTQFRRCPSVTVVQAGTRKKMIQKSSHFSLSTLGLALLFAFTPKSAQALVWDGSVSNNWFTGLNWVTGITPAPGADVFIGQSGRNNTFFPVFNTGQSVQGMGELRVGVNTTGSLRIENGSSLGSLSSYIGYASGSSGLTTVLGFGSNLTTNNFYVGYGGEGQLQITGSGRVVATDSIIGTNSGSIGNATVSGTASRWDNSGRLYIGSSGSGTLTITDGGAVSNASSGYIGSSVGGTGLVTIRDAGSQWLNPAGLIVGHVSSGTLRVENGGTIIVGTGGYIGNDASGVGSVTITGLGSRWNSTSGLAVGFNGNGTLRVFDSGGVSNINGYIGFNSGSSGTAIVSGTGSQWINSGRLTVGGAGNGTLLVENNGLVSATQFIGQGRLSLDGGTLQALASDVHFIDFTGAGTFELLSGGGAIDSNGFEIGTSSVISGAGSLTKTGTGTLTLTTANIYSGNTNVTQGTFTLNGAGSISSIGAVDITNGATFQINETTSNSGNYTFANSLTGNGLLRVNLQANTNVFSFAPSAGSGFAGTVALDNSTFSLANENTQALSNATLELGTGSFTTVGAGTQNIGNLKMAGGSLTFNGAVPPGPLTSQIATNNLDLSSGIIRVDIPTLVGVPNPAPAGGTNLLAQDDGLVLSQLIAASGAISGSAANLTLTDLTGNAISDVTLAINESSIAVANAKYGFDLTTGSINDGLYLSYGLTELDLISGQTLHLRPDSGATASTSTLSAKVTGLGSLDLDASTSADQILTINNSTNDYTGKTTASAGTLVLGSNQALGQTSELAIASAATIDVNGKTQSLGLLSGAGTLDVNAGDLTVTDGGDFSGTIIGTSGDLNLSGGTLTLTGSNAYTGSTTVLAGELAIGNGGVSGSYTGDITNNATVSFNRSNASTYAAEISGTGTVDKEGAGTLVLTGDNTYTGDTTITEGTLQIGAGGTTGSLVSNIINNGSLVFNRSDAVTNQSLINGSGSLTQQGSGSLTLTEANSYTGGTTITSGTLNLANDSAASTGSIANNSGLELSFNAGNLDNTITGAGSTLVSGNAVTISGANTAYSGAWSITGSANIGSMDHLGSGSVNVAGLLNANPSSGNLNFNNVLTGNGTLAVNMGTASDAFSFTGTTGSGFTGTLRLGQSSFDLSAINADVLSSATLDLRNGSSTTLSEDRSIGNLSLGGGALHVRMSSPTVAHILSVDHLNVDVISGGLPIDIGTVDLDVASLSSGAVSGNFFDQDDVSTSGGIQVVSANTVSTSGKHLNLTLQGNAPIDTTYTGQSDGYGNDDISATYSYMAVSTANASLPNGAGLYVSYVLKSLETQTDLVLSTTGATNTSLGAQITGVGNVEYRGNSDTITLLNSANDYSGQSLVSSGTLLFGADNVLGNTSGLTIASNAAVDINGMTQNIGEFTGQFNSLLNINGGDLTITAGGNSQGGLTGAGRLTFAGGNMVINGSNSGLSADVMIDSGASTQINHALGLGSGEIVDDGTLVLAGLNGTLANQISGTGILNVADNSDVMLAGANTGYAGTIDINAGSRLTVAQLVNFGNANLLNDGELVLNQSGDETLTNMMTGSGVLTKSGMGTIHIDSNYAHTGGTHVNAGTFILETPNAELSGGGIVSVADGATLGGYGKITGTVQNNGVLAVADAVNGLANGAGTLFIQGDLVNHNTVKLAGNTVGNILNVSGNYSAASDLIINTVLGGDSSLTDKLIVQGNTSGHTNVTVHNQGGTGAQTVNGIEIIEVGGVSAGTFSLANRVAYGAYDYGLVQTGNNWYLKSKTESGIRAEVGAYLANQTAAKDMFTSSLYTRMGESLFATERSAQNHDLSSWVRVGGHVTESRAAGQIDQKIWSSNVQIGTDIANNIAETNRWHLGVMAGSGSANTRSKTDHKAEVARSDIEGYSVGVYGTWFANGKPASTGPYVDSWLQYGWYDNSVKGDGLAKEQSYDSSTLTASIETGWGFKLYENQESQLILQPQLQLTYVHYDADDLIETNGTKVQNSHSDGLISRVGARLYGNIDTQSGQQWQPFVEANWLHDSSSEKVRMNGDSFGSDIPKDRLDVKVGIQAQANKDWSIWSYVGAQTGSHSYSRIEGAAGVRYQW